MLLQDAALALPKDVVLHELLPRFNPWKLEDLRSVLKLREVFVDTDDGRRRLITDDDLKECYFEKAWQFRKDEFVLAGWREMSVEEMKVAVKEAYSEMKYKVRGAHPQVRVYRLFYPAYKVDVDTLETKEDIVRAYWELTYVPWQVYRAAVADVHMLGLVEAGEVGEDPVVVGRYLNWACRAGLDASVIRGLAGKCGEGGIDKAPPFAARGGHTDVVDLLVSEFGARIGVYCLIMAAWWGQDAMIDHLVERYGLDPNAVDGGGWTALRSAAWNGRVRTVRHLVEKHHVDIHARSMDGKTALDWAEADGRTECADCLRDLSTGT
jgi:hypothetical protein